MKNFVSEMIELGFSAALEIPRAKKKIEEVSDCLEELFSDNGMDVEDFFDMYNTRIYNFDSKRDDIKIMKKYDFAGVYIIHNVTRDLYFVRKSENVLKKIDRHFRGYEDADIYEDYENGDDFIVKAVRFDTEIHNSLSSLEKELIKEYGVYFKNKKIKENIKLNDKKLEKENTKSSVITILVCFVMLIVIFLFALYMSWYYSTPKLGEIKITINPKDYIGVDYKEVYTKFEEMGFTDIKCVPKEDLITGWIHENGETAEITINKSEFLKDDIYDKDADVEIFYHSYKENK